jgi:DNA polymerase elongation subunit (family B)
MTVNEIVKFLNTRPGYVKEGSKRLANKVLKGKASVENCKLALQIVNNTVENKIKEIDKNLKDKEELKVLICDIETSYNIVSSWRAGYKINIPHYAIIKERAIICVSYKWLGEKTVYSLTWDKNQDDKFLLEDFIEVMNEADVIVAHNADNFDIKWLKTRALKHGLEMLPKYNTVDTLWLAKKHFYFNSNKLDYISKFLGFEGKINTDPGLWDRVILDKDLEALLEMVEYCEEDVRQLEKVYNALKRFDKPKQHAGVLNFNDKYSSPITGTRSLTHLKKITTPAGTIKHIVQDNITNRKFEMSNKNYQKWLEEDKKLNQAID